MSAEVRALRGWSLFGVPGRAVELFLRSRQAWQAPLGITAAAMLGTWLVRRYDEEWLSQSSILVPTPLLMACLIGAVTGSPFGEPERTAALPLPALRLGLLAGLMGLAAACLLASNASFTWFEPPVEKFSLWMATSEGEVARALARNLLVFTGIALLGARLMGAGLAWVGPLGYGMLSLVVLMLAAVGDDNELILPAWTLPVLPATDGRAFLLAAAVAALGLAAVAPIGASDRQGEAAG